jgi:hypothetical protein
MLMVVSFLPRWRCGFGNAKWSIGGWLTARTSVLRDLPPGLTYFTYPVGHIGMGFVLLMCTNISRTAFIMNPGCCRGNRDVAHLSAV